MRSDFVDLKKRADLNFFFQISVHISCHFLDAVVVVYFCLSLPAKVRGIHIAFVRDVKIREMWEIWE